ncbi:hypothetical protein ABPG75_006052 [Micractinium tetrahymenae]
MPPHWLHAVAASILSAIPVATCCITICMPHQSRWPSPFRLANHRAVKHPRCRVAGKDLNWDLEVAPGGLSIISPAPAPPHRSPLARLQEARAGSQRDGVSAAATPKVGLRILYIRAKFPADCSLAPGQQTASTATVADVAGGRAAAVGLLVRAHHD